MSLSTYPDSDTGRSKDDNDKNDFKHEDQGLKGVDILPVHKVSNDAVCE